jgi:pyrimidine-nucleoside phosphorylase
MEEALVSAYDVIRKKRDGGVLDEDEMRAFVAGCLSGEVPDYQASAFLMAVVLRGMTPGETVALTRIMLESGRTLRFDALPGPLLDKHSTGGVGDKVSIPLLPIAASCGLFVPMISGRSLGHTGGTLDKLESIPGMTTALGEEAISRQVRSHGGCFAAQTADLVPADRMFYALRDAVAAVESVPLIVSSILSKKLAEGIAGVVIDVKCGRGAFMETIGGARELAGALEAAGEAMGVPVKTLVTAMDEPLGAAVGNAIEIEESIRVLEGRGPADVASLTVRLAAEMFVLGGLAPSVADGEAIARRAIDSGRALERFERIVAAQGGRLDPGAPRFGLPAAPVTRIVPAAERGYLSRLDARAVGEAVRGLGGGRLRREDAVDPAVGIVCRKKTGDAVAPGDPLFEIHAASAEGADAAARRLARATGVSAEPVPRARVVLDRTYPD